MRLLLLACTALSPSAALAGDLPTGGRVARGEVDISTPSAKRMEIGQSSSRAVVHWNDFSVGQGAAVDIRQPSSKAAILNRVDGSVSTRIHGSLRANGQVFVANPNGVVIGPSGRVETGGGFVASSLAIGDDDFMAGRLRFEGDGRSTSVSNEGSITVGPGGFAALLGGRVSNAGTVVVPLGRVGLGAGERVTLDVSGDRFLQVALPSELDGEDGALIEHAGKIAAQGGRVEISAATARNAVRYAVNLSGVVEARSVSGRSGAIVLGGGDGGRVRITGAVLTRPATTPASSPAPMPRPGGAITVTGARIELAGATIDASGDGGGSVRIGGDWQGAGTLPWADATLVDAASAIRANALGAGDGGTVVVWSGGHTGFAGTISARGGPEGGDGGAAEVSGKAHLSFGGTVDLTAPAGATGTLLLDPYNLLITNAGSENLELASSTNPDGEVFQSYSAAGIPSILDAEELSNALATAEVTVSTGIGGEQDGDITVAAPLSWSSDHALTLDAANDILLQAAISASAGGLVLDAGGDITTTPAGTVEVGSFLLQAGNWEQDGAAFPGGVLPDFEAGDFAIANDGAAGNPSFLRVLGGTGSVDDPYLITDVYGLQGIDSSGYDDDAFALANGIDGSATAVWNGGDGFNPIGEEEGPFTPFGGSFDGNGFALSNFALSGTTAGIFGSTDGASISNLDLVNVDVSGTEFVGGLIGDAVDTQVDQVRIDSTSTVTGTVGETHLAVGGLIGRLAPVEGEASLTNAVSSAAVVEQGSPEVDGTLTTSVGNLVGLNDGAIATALAEGSVTATATEGPGGLSREIGGAVGGNEGSIEQVYTRGLVNVSGDGSIDVGGLTGVVFDGSSVVESYAAGPILAPDDATVGGLIGTSNIELGLTGENSFWDIVATGVSVSEGGEGLANSTMTSLTEFIAAAGPAWSFAEVWAPPDGTKHARLYALEPVVWAVPEEVSVVYGDTASLTLQGEVFGGPGSYLFDDPDDTLPDQIFDSAGLPDGDVGIYPITVPDPIFSALGVEYEVVLSPADLEITERPLTVTALDVSKTYGTEYQFTEADLTAPNLANGDVLTPDILTSAGAAADAPVADSPYPIVFASTDPQLDNYAVTQVFGDLAVEPAPLTIATFDRSKTYDDVYVFGEDDYEITGEVLGETIDGTLASLGAPRSAQVADSPYAIVFSSDDPALDNYDVTRVVGDLTVTPAQLTFAADPKTRSLGSSNPLLTGSYSGFVLGEGTEVLATTAGLSTTAEQESPVGQYPIDAFGPPLDGNYAIVYLDSTLTVEPVDIQDRPAWGGDGRVPDAPGRDTILTGLGDAPDSVTGAISGAADIEVAAATLEAVRLYSNGLEVAAAACRQSEAQISDYLSCISEALESFAASLEEIALQMPPELREVSAIIRRAGSGVDAARRRAEARLAAATTPEARAAIEAEAMEEASAAVESARNEIRIAIELIRVEDSDLARTEAATGGAIAAALETVEFELVRATEL